MNREKSSGEFRRASTSDQKEQRRLSILAAAEKHLRESGFDSFSMGVLAKDVGIARSTLYLYFATREEVLITLYANQVRNWCDSLIKTTYPEISDEAFLEAFMEASLQDPLFEQLSARLGDTIEYNVSLERLLESKKWMYAILTKIAEHTAEVLNIDHEKAMTLVFSLGALILGIRQIDAGPKLDQSVLPEHIQEMMQKIDSRSIFLNTGKLIISGLR